MGELAFIGVAVAILLAGSMASRHVTYTDAEDNGSVGLGRGLADADDLGDLGDVAGD